MGRCENCGAFLTRKPSGEVGPWQDERVPYGCIYWTCRRCGYQLAIDKPKPDVPEPKNWATIPF